LDDDQDGGWVSVSSGTGSLGWSRTKGCKTVVVVVVVVVVVTKPLFARYSRSGDFISTAGHTVVVEEFHCTSTNGTDDAR